MYLGAVDIIKTKDTATSMIVTLATFDTGGVCLPTLPSRSDRRIFEFWNRLNIMTEFKIIRTRNGKKETEITLIQGNVLW